ncbi:MAG: ammonia-forming cytochrome c nitrite reductase subunit c552 [Chloroflexi bacterium]|nr:ammonia-forming cytochrome c nitrite reductase subunit c552 [Chloroflexota bacterium]
MRRPKLTHIFPFLAGIVLVALVMAGSRSETARAAPDAIPVNAPAVQMDNSDCLVCHNRPKFTTSLPNDEKLVLTIDEDKFNKSVHGENQIACTDCHADFTSFPHDDLKANSLREIATTYYTTCQQCHAEQYNKVLDSVHQRALAGGNTNAAVCSDCHNPHEQTRITNKDSGEILITARLHIPQTCASCHSTIYDAYKNSVHGNALTEENNTDVPTCIDCHGVHNIQDPTTVTFRNSTPFLCAKCHTDSTIMDKYGISTNVLNSYVADFHGTTVKLFEEEFPGQPTNKPVCTDCHGVHNISKVDNIEAGIALRENLLIKCQRCHPGATANFPAAWMSHYEPSPEHYPIVYYVNLFYKFFIPTVLGGMTFFVITDIYRRIVNRVKGVRHS